MVNPSAPSPIFLTNAEILLRRLGAVDSSPEASSISSEVEAIIETFRGWQTTTPQDELRVATIQRFIDLNRRAMEFLSKLDAKGYE